MEARALLQAAKRGEMEALEELCRLYHPRLCRYAYALTRSREEAEDVAQEALVSMLRALPDFRGADAGKFEGWLLRIARNRVYSEARRKRPAPIPEGFEPPDPAPLPGERLEQAERRARLLRTLDGLDAESRRWWRSATIWNFLTRRSPRRWKRAPRASSGACATRGKSCASCWEMWRFEIRWEGERRRGSVTAAARENAMGGQDMNEKLFAEMDWQTDAAVRALRGEMLLRRHVGAEAAAAAGDDALRPLRLCVCAAHGVGAVAGARGRLEGRGALRRHQTALICAGATLLLSPLLAYFMEGRGEHA